MLSSNTGAITIMFISYLTKLLSCKVLWRCPGEIC